MTEAAGKTGAGDGGTASTSKYVSGVVEMNTQTSKKPRILYIRQRPTRSGWNTGGTTAVHTRPLLALALRNQLWRLLSYTFSPRRDPPSPVHPHQHTPLACTALIPTRAASCNLNIGVQAVAASHGGAVWEDDAHETSGWYINHQPLPQRAVPLGSDSGLTGACSSARWGFRLQCQFSYYQIQLDRCGTRK